MLLRTCEQLHHQSRSYSSTWSCSVELTKELADECIALSDGFSPMHFLIYQPVDGLDLPLVQLVRGSKLSAKALPEDT